jgi:hypothetical protein
MLAVETNDTGVAARPVGSYSTNVAKRTSTFLRTNTLTTQSTGKPFDVFKLSYIWKQFVNI